ncbi:hypothetical protein FIU93_22545 [Labrenzia sp. THAF35]|uniref:hypothetical protein n=1 Tax=Labrenzia sp. THAF35 TaxID=2587854 RepID=UPI00126850FD|nr:hypothetical protein [Labrenzia sp. THAF35]QFT69582.1 hypothetical protein FIU93_22545 [Labrenzia sp. THAF35]
MAKQAKIKDRIVAALKSNGGFMLYYDLARVVFPKEHYPNAWNYPTRGGPPGCYMVLSRAIREHGFNIVYDCDVVHSTVYLGRNNL